MAPLKVLICGGGCAGPALAFWLAHTGHQVTVVERFPVLRSGGAQIDLRGAGIEAVKRMGLLEAVQSKLVDEQGTAMVDSNGNVKATILANKSGQGAQTLTSEYEIMRGDLVRILYEVTKDNVHYMFGKTVDSFDQDEKQVIANFSDGSSRTYDLLVGADGQGSRIRRAIWSPDSPDPYYRLGTHVAYCFIPRIKSDTNMKTVYNCPGGRMIMRRSHSSTETQVLFFLKDDSPEISSLSKASIEQQRAFWAQRFRDAGWQADRFLAGMEATDNWYCQEVVQVRTNTWHQGRVVLLGDAAHCPSPWSGMGTSSALVGAYVLAGEINRRPDDLAQAFVEYDKVLRPYVNQCQEVHTSLIKLAMPESWWGVAILRFVFQALCFLRLPELIARFSTERDGGWQLPDYAELWRSQ